MVDIPAGLFYMGSNDKESQPDERPVHKVAITKPFKMSATEVTNAQYERFRPEHKKLRGKNGVSCGDNDAVVNVSYDDAVAYCEWLSKREGKHYRLPTEAEWEYACRAGTYTRYFFGDWLPESESKNQRIVRDYAPVSLAVAQGKPNAFGLYDMHGNVEEWCLDWYAPYSASDESDPQGPAYGEYRVTRGGSHNTPSQYLRSANRMAMIPSDKHSLTGFRIVEAAAPDALADAQMFMEPIVYVKEPVYGSTAFGSHNHQPSVIECPNGDMLAIWFSANEENSRDIRVLSSRLKKGTGEWTPAEHFFSVPDRNITGSALFRSGDNEIMHINGVEAAGDWQNLAVVMRRSHDNGYTWSAPQIIAPEHAKRHQVISGTIRLSDGSILQACDAGPTGDAGTAVLLSHDNGATWQDPYNPADEIKFDNGGKGSTIAGIHAGVVELADGRLMALGRGNAIADSHGRARMPKSISSDGGATWTYSASEFPPIDGGQRLVLMRLKEGPLMLASFTDHPQRTPESERGMTFKDSDGNESVGYGMFVALSYDDGETWPVRRLLTDGTTRMLDGGAWTGAFIMDSSHAEPRGYFAGTQAEDGTIHLVSSRLHYRFNLNWIERKND